MKRAAGLDGRSSAGTRVSYIIVHQRRQIPPTRCHGFPPKELLLIDSIPLLCPIHVGVNLGHQNFRWTSLRNRNGLHVKSAGRGRGRKTEWFATGEQQRRSTLHFPGGLLASTCEKESRTPHEICDLDLHWPELHAPSNGSVGWRRLETDVLPVGALDVLQSEMSDNGLLQSGHCLSLGPGLTSRRTLPWGHG